MKKRIISVLCIAALTIGMFAGCGKKAETGEKETKEASEKIFTVAVSSLPDSLIPTSRLNQNISIVRPAYDPLFAEDENGYYYFLADKLEVSDDGMTYTLHLNEDANWSDGEPVTVDDILFTIDYYSQVLNTPTFESVAGKEITNTKIDDKTMEVKLPIPYAAYPTILSALSPLPSHAFDGDVTKVDGSDYFKTPGMVTSGAYTVEEINEDSCVYVKRDDYYRGTADPDKVVMKTIGSGSTKQVAFENGEISYMSITSAEDLKKYQSETEKYNLYSIAKGELTMLVTNPLSDTFANEDARKAVFLAMDNQEMVDAAFGDELLSVTANEYMTPQQGLYDKDIEGYSQDLEAAKKLAESGGIAGKTIKYAFNSEREGMEAIATIVQQQLAKIDVTVEIEPLDSATFGKYWELLFSTDNKECTWDLMSQTLSGMYGKSSSSLATVFSDPYGTLNFSDELKQCAQALMVTTDENKAKELATTMQKLALEQYKFYPVSYNKYVMVSGKDIEGLDECQIYPEFADYLCIKMNK